MTATKTPREIQIGDQIVSGRGGNYVRGFVARIDNGVAYLRNWNGTEENGKSVPLDKARHYQW